MLLYRYIYGDLRSEAATINGSMTFNDVYILSLPALVWIKWYPRLRYRRMDITHFLAMLPMARK